MRMVGQELPVRMEAGTTCQHASKWYMCTWEQELPVCGGAGVTCVRGSSSTLIAASMVCRMMRDSSTDRLGGEEDRAVGIKIRIIGYHEIRHAYYYLLFYFML